MNFTKKFEVNKSSLKKPYVIAAWYSAVKKEWNLKVSKTIQKQFWIFSFIVTNDITGENLCVCLFPFTVKASSDWTNNK